MPFAIWALVLLIWSGQAMAWSWRELPLMGGEHPFSLRLLGNNALQDELKTQLNQERAANAELRQLTDPQAIARYETDILARALRAKGYYAAEVQWELGARILYQVQPGPLYQIKNLSFDLPPLQPALDVQSLGIAEGQPLDAGLVLAVQSRIAEYYQTHSCLYEIAVTYDARVNHATHDATLAFVLAPSQSAQFGEVRFAGASAVEPEHLANYLTFEPGDCFRRKALDKSRLELLQSGLLANVTAQVQPLQGNRADILMQVAERRPRTIKTGLTYDGDAGAGLGLGWEHRNLFGRGEKLSVTGDFSQLNTKVDSQITLPHFGAKAQNLVLHANIERQTPEAYTSTKGDFGIALNRRINPTLTLGAGVDALLTRDEKAGSAETTGLLGLPFTADINRRDDLFDPRTGWNLGAKTEAFWDVQNLGNQFQKSTLAASLYYTAETWRFQPTFALRGAAGSILGESLAAIPASERFYVGGGGSVRGYTYQSLGELIDGKPDGGLSFGETSGELRLRLSSNWGLVVFVDGGYAYPESTPSWGNHFLWGAGLGVRYYTSFAPIRFDLASPLSHRDTLKDDPVQLYISIGQAF